MNKTEKLNYLIEHHREEYLKTRNEMENKLSDSQPLFCICGKLATGLHERSCSKFKNKVDSMVIEALKDKLPKK